MSWVANLMVLADRDDGSNVESLSAWLSHGAVHGMGSLNSLTVPNDYLPGRPRNNQWGGPKNPECDLWAGTLNHADLEEVLAHIRNMPWNHPGAVQIFLMDQEQSYFRLYMFREGAWNQYSPDPPPDADDQKAW
jgi:hypothetical protein